MIESKRIAQTNLTDTLTTLYTVPSDKTLIIRNLSLVNLTEYSRTVNLVVLPDSASLSDEHYYAKNLELAAGETKMLTGKLILEAGDSLQANCSVSGDVTVQVYGGEYTPVTNSPYIDVDSTELNEAIVQRHQHANDTVLNGIEVALTNDLADNLMTLDGTQTITGDKDFTGDLTIDGSPIYNTVNIDGGDAFETYAPSQIYNAGGAI